LPTDGFSKLTAGLFQPAPRVVLTTRSTQFNLFSSSQQ
jgi:hypothetical protein